MLFFALTWYKQVLGEVMDTVVGVVPVEVIVLGILLSQVSEEIVGEGVVVLTAQPITL